MKTHKVKVKVPAGVEGWKSNASSRPGRVGFNGGLMEIQVSSSVSAKVRHSCQGADIYYQLHVNFAALKRLLEMKLMYQLFMQGELKCLLGRQSGTIYAYVVKGAPKLRGTETVTNM